MSEYRPGSFDIDTLRHNAEWIADFSKYVADFGGDHAFGRGPFAVRPYDNVCITFSRRAETIRGLSMIVDTEGCGSVMWHSYQCGAVSSFEMLYGCPEEMQTSVRLMRSRPGGVAHLYVDDRLAPDLCRHASTLVRLGEDMTALQPAVTEGFDLLLWLKNMAPAWADRLMESRRRTGRAIECTYAFGEDKPVIYVKTAISDSRKVDITARESASRNAGDEMRLALHGVTDIDSGTKYWTPVIAPRSTISVYMLAAIASAVEDM